MERHGSVRETAHELPHVLDLAAMQLVRRAGGDDLALRKQKAVMRDGRQLVHVVRDDDRGDAQCLVHLLDEPADDPHGDGIEADEGLVVDEDVGIHDDRPGQGDATRHAARELGRHQPRGPPQTDGMQLREHQVPHERLGQLRVRAQWKGDVFVDIHVGEQRPVLEQHAHAASHGEQFLVRHLRDVLAEHADVAALGVDLPGDELEQRRLAGARGAHDRGDPAAASGDVESVEDRAAADGVAHISDLNNSIAGLRRRSVCNCRGGSAQAAVASGVRKAAKDSKRHPPRLTGRLNPY
jgi:hypothetical protein